MLLRNSPSHLLLGGVKGKITDVQRAALLQKLLLFIAVTLKKHEQHFKLWAHKRCPEAE